MVVIADRSGGLKKEPELERLRSLTKPLRLEVVDKDAFSEFLVGLRTFHYRAKLRSEADYVDVYYDTEDWRLSALVSLTVSDKGATAGKRESTQFG